MNKQIELIFNYFYKNISKNEKENLKKEISNSKELREWDHLINGISNTSFFKNKLKFNDFLEFSKRVIKSESPDFIIDNEIGIEISNHLLEEEAKALKQLDDKLVKNSKNNIYISENAGKIIEVLVKPNDTDTRINSIKNKLSVISKFKKYKENYWFLSLSNTGTYLFEEMDQFLKKLIQVFQQLQINNINLEFIERFSSLIIFKYN